MLNRKTIATILLLATAMLPGCTQQPEQSVAPPRLVSSPHATAPPATPREPPSNQYHLPEEMISVPAAHSDEPTRSTFSLELAQNYVESGAYAWTKSQQCVTCHTNGTYMLIRPSLSDHLGPPAESVRKFFVESLRMMKQDGEDPAPLVYIAAGLAEWDAHVSESLSPETEDALEFMLEVQSEDGSWDIRRTYPPLESSPYQLATVAAKAVATAPGWLAKQKDRQVLKSIKRLMDYLRGENPPHDYARLLLLWTSTRMLQLVDDAKKQQLIEMIWRHQRDDGGWSIRSFARPEQWGDGGRADRLRNEPDADNPSSDGHQTGLALIVLREAGVAAEDSRIQQAVKWLKANQRESGRWWTRSLNTDRYHYITYSGTCYPLLALAKCNALD